MASSPKNIQDIIALGLATEEGKAYLFRRPTRLWPLLLQDFQLAEKYFEIFDSQIINAFVETMRKQYNGFGLITQMIALLCSQSEPAGAYPVIVKSIHFTPPENYLTQPALLNQHFLDLLPELKIFYTTGTVAYTYDKQNTLIRVATNQKLDKHTIKNEKFKYYYPGILSDNHEHWETRQYVRQHLPQMIISFLKKIEGNNNLDFEFAGQTNSFILLAQNGYDHIITALTKVISPEEAKGQLQSIVDNVPSKKSFAQSLMRSLSSNAVVSGNAMMRLSISQAASPTAYTAASAPKKQPS